MDRTNNPLAALLSRSKSDRTCNPAIDPEVIPCVQSATLTSIDEKGPLGLTTLHEPAAPTTPVAEIVFIHGLGGGSRKTWSYSPDPQHYWPEAWLSTDQEFGDVRVHTFGYKADWSQRKDSILDIAAFAQSLLGALRNHPSIRRSQTLIILVGHSMGGCVAKKTCILAREDPATLDFAKRIQSIFFLATPHRGSDMASLLGNVMFACLGAWGKKPFVGDLVPNSSVLVSINDAFRHIAPDLRLWSFYETMTTSILGFSRLVVDKHSATLGYPNEEISPINANHRQACKFSSPSDPNYRILRNALISAIDQARLTRVASSPTEGPSVTSTLQAPGIAEPKSLQYSRSRIRSFLGFHDSHEETLVKLRLLKEPGTCHWFSQKSSFVAWMESLGPQVLWLKGRPGTGKSILSSHVISCLEEASVNCSYFFFRSNESGGSELATCLRSLAFQMALRDETARELLLRLADEDFTWDKLNETSVWHQIFRSCIFKAPSLAKHAWVLDGVDECPSFNSLFSQRLLSSLPPGLRVFATSRSLGDVERGLSGLGPEKVVIEALSEVDTLSDMRLYVTARLNELGRPEKEVARQQMSEEILDRARGLFLWIRLVLQELQRCWTVEAMYAALQEIPADLNAMYARMIQSIIVDNRKMALAASIFNWVALSIRPLTVDELCDAVELSTGQKLQNPANAIPEICAQLVYVNHENNVYLIHDTVREFFMSGSLPTTLAVHKPSGHTTIGIDLLKYLSMDSQIPSSTVIPPRDPKQRFAHHNRNTPGAFSSMTNLSHGQRFLALARYARLHFTLHIYKATAKSDELMKYLTAFLQSQGIARRHHVLDWIEQIAAEGDLAVLTRSAMNLRDYCVRRLKYCAPLDSSVQLLDNWVNDLLRVPAKFNAQLLTCPSSIHHLIPSLCPTSSAISSLVHQPSPHFQVAGISQTRWDDCLLTIDVQEGLGTTVSYGRRMFAVAGSTGLINIYSHKSLQRVRQTNHPERVIMLLFSLDDMYLASCGKKQLILWKANLGVAIHALALEALPLCLAFDGLEGIICTLQSGRCTRWDISTSNSTSKSWDDRFIRGYEQDPPSTSRYLKTQPARAAFLTLNRETYLVAIGYAYRPVFVLELTSDLTIRDSMICQHNRAVHNHGIQCMVFNPHPEIPVLAVSYSDGSLCIFSYESSLEAAEVYYRAGIYAVTMAISQDGRYLAIGTASGILEVFEFDYAPRYGRATLEPFYRQTNPLEEAIRGIDFSSDGLRLLETRASKSSVWTPAALVRKNPSDAESTAASSQPHHVALQPCRQSAYQQVVGGSAITAPLIAHPNWDLVLAGRANGDIVMFSTATALSTGIAYRHKSGAAVIHMAIAPSGKVIASADNAANVLLAKLPPHLDSKEEFAITFCRHLPSSVHSLLFSPDASKLLVTGRSFQELWDLSTLEITTPLTPISDEGHRTMPSSVRSVSLQHPGNPEWFVIVNKEIAKVYSWSQFTDISTICRTHLQKLGPEHDCMDDSQETLLSETGSIIYHSGQGLVLEEVSRTHTSSPELKIWSAERLDAAQISVVKSDEDSLLNTIKHNVHRVLGILGRSTLLFLDTNLWVCSLQLQPGVEGQDSKERQVRTTVSENQEDTKGAPKAEPGLRRHFFTLSEWRGGHGHINCAMTIKHLSEAGAVDKIFPGEVTLTFAHDDHVVVVKRGLTFSQTITPNMDVDSETRGMQDPWTVVSGTMRSRSGWTIT